MSESILEPWQENLLRQLYEPEGMTWEEALQRDPQLLAKLWQQTRRTIIGLPAPLHLPADAEDTVVTEDPDARRR